MSALLGDLVMSQRQSASFVVVAKDVTHDDGDDDDDERGDESE